MIGVTQCGCSTSCLPGKTALSNTQNNQPNELRRIPKPRLAGVRVPPGAPQKPVVARVVSPRHFAYVVPDLNAANLLLIFV